MSAAAPAPASPAAPRLPNALLFGTGEYTTGCVDGAASTSDKPMGVVALSFFDLRLRGLVGPRIALCGRRSSRNPAIRAHFAQTLARYTGMDVDCDLYPQHDGDKEGKAYEALLTEDGPFQAGDVAVITTPDDTHAAIALACIQRGMHCLIAKPVVQSLEEHWSLLDAAEAYDTRALEQAIRCNLPPPRPLVLSGEFHKRFDPLYADAAARIARGTMGDLSYFHAYMSQPKSQLNTFRAWLVGGSGGAGGQARSAPSDISYYLNAHHIDLLHLATAPRSRPVWVQALAARGCANAILSSGGADGKANKVDIEDTITVTVQYVHDGPQQGSSASASSADAASEPGYGVAVFTSSWVAPRGSVHSQQRFHFLGTEGEVSVDQANRGYIVVQDSCSPGATAASANGSHREVASLNPLFMRYAPGVDGAFVGQQGYGYKSFEHFVEAATGRRMTGLSPLALLGDQATLYTTAVLQAARRSLDQDNRKVRLVYDEQRRPLRVE